MRNEDTRKKKKTKRTRNRMISARNSGEREKRQRTK